jgi:hypothetical protein
MATKPSAVPENDFLIESLLNEQNAPNMISIAWQIQKGMKAVDSNGLPAVDRLQYLQTGQKALIDRLMAISDPEAKLSMAGVLEDAMTDADILKALPEEARIGYLKTGQKALADAMVSIPEGREQYLVGCVIKEATRANTVLDALSAQDRIGYIADSWKILTEAKDSAEHTSNKDCYQQYLQEIAVAKKCTPCLTEQQLQEAGFLQPEGKTGWPLTAQCAVMIAFLSNQDEAVKDIYRGRLVQYRNVKIREMEEIRAADPNASVLRPQSARAELVDTLKALRPKKLEHA